VVSFSSLSASPSGIVVIIPTAHRLCRLCGRQQPGAGCKRADLNAAPRRADAFEGRGRGRVFFSIKLSFFWVLLSKEKQKKSLKVSKYF
jgi:hypothetical protein